MLFDFDGTLSPIVRHPNRANLPVKWRNYLRRLNAHPRLDVGIVTGRSYADIKRRVSIRGLMIASKHGYEIWRGGRCLVRKGLEYRGPMSELGEAIKRGIGKIPGVIIESKGVSVAVHYRMVEEKLQRHVVNIIIEISTPFLEERGLELMRGKKVVEVRPADCWDKGKAVSWIWRRQAPRSLPCYFGDDTTDEDVFEEIGGRGITARIGRSHSSRASYYAKDIDEIIPWIEWLLKEF